MNDNQFKASLKLLGMVVVLELIGIGLFCYTYFVKGYYGVRNLGAIILGGIVIIMMIVRIVKGKIELNK